MSYFWTTRDEPTPRRHKQAVPAQPHADPKSGRHHEQHPPPAQGDGGGLLGHLMDAGEACQVVEGKRKHPVPASHVFDPTYEPQQHPSAKSTRVRNVPEDVLRGLQPAPDTKKVDAAVRISEGPSMVEKMLGCNYPINHPSENEHANHRFQPDFAKKRNASQIAVGGYHALPPEPFQQYPGAKRSVQVDYATYVPDRIQPKRFYTVDGKIQDGAQQGPLVKNLFSDEPLLCSKFITDGNRVAAPAEPAVPEPPRRLPFEHGHKLFY